MLKVLLLLATLDPNTGAIVSLWDPVPAFETTKDCEDALKAAKATPGLIDGHLKLVGKCVPASDLN